MDVISKLIEIRQIIMGHMLKTRRGDANLSGIFGGFIVILVDLVLFPTVQNTVDTELVNASTAVKALGALIPMFWVLVGLGIGAALVYKAFKDTG